jgi:hypothetical protein
VAWTKQAIALYLDGNITKRSHHEPNGPSSGGRLYPFRECCVDVPIFSDVVTFSFHLELLDDGVQVVPLLGSESLWAIWQDRLKHTQNRVKNRIDRQVREGRGESGEGVKEWESTGRWSEREAVRQEIGRIH